MKRRCAVSCNLKFRACCPLTSLSQKTSGSFVTAPLGYSEHPMKVVPNSMSHVCDYRSLGISAAQPWSLQLEDPFNVMPAHMNVRTRNSIRPAIGKHQCAKVKAWSSANPRLCTGPRLDQGIQDVGKDFADKRECFSNSSAQRSLIA